MVEIIIAFYKILSRGKFSVLYIDPLHASGDQVIRDLNRDRFLLVILLNLDKYSRLLVLCIGLFSEAFSCKLNFEDGC